MTFEVFKLTFHTPLHLSRGKIGSYESSATVLHSDKLKSALYATAVQLFGSPPEGEEAIIAGDSDGQVEHIANVILKKIRISSAFPFNARGYWLPRPLSFKPKPDDPKQRKALKQLRYLNSEQFEQVARGEQPANLLSVAQPEVWEREVTQRVKVSYEADSEPFYLEKLYARRDAGLYIIVEKDEDLSDESESWQKFNAVLRLLGDNGIGLQRALGNGQFTAERDTFSLTLPESATNWMALSLYRPAAKSEVEPHLARSFYQFTKRGGWVSAPEKEDNLSLRKKSVMMFTEGSVFNFGEQEAATITKGQIVDLRPEIDTVNHPIWRDGRAIFLPIIK